MNRNINAWIESGEYQTDIDSALTNIVRQSECSSSESETASIFERELYYLLRNRIGIELYIQKETAVKGIFHKFDNTISNGRLDAVINDLIIEYKHYSALQSQKEIEEAINQVSNYLITLESTRGESHDAILTDGIRIIYFSFVGKEVRHTSIKVISKDDIDTILKAILNNRTKKFEPRNIVQDFAISENSDSASKTIAKILYQELTENISDRSQMLFLEWQSLMHLSVEDNGKSRDIEKRRADLSRILDRTISDTTSEYKALFSLQTTYAIIVKLIACKVVNRLNFNSDTNEYHDLLELTSDRLCNFFRKMEDGYSYSSQRIRNFLEGDFFSWYSDPAQWGEAFFQNIKKTIELVDGYSAFSLDVSYNPIDVFKDLYMSIIPQSVRHSMGEYFTPEWVADRVISKAIDLIQKPNWKSIDPCCGSGIFIIGLIKKIVGNRSVRELSPQQRIEIRDSVLERVYGVDINPLSVLSARVSYFIALHKLGDVEAVEIPIFLGDSAIVPSQIKIDNIECYSYKIDNLKCKGFEVILPRRMVAEKSFGKMMSDLQALVKTDNAEVLFTAISQQLSEIELNSEELVNKIKKLSENLVFLHENNWDGIWIRIVMNFMMIARMQSFDLIVGNPPWVKWEHLPTSYTHKIKEFCDIRHIFCNDGGMFGGAQLNICALISNVVATNWLTKNGILAFLMPDSLMSQNSYEEFRNFYIDFSHKERLYLQTLDRWMAPMRPFKVGKKPVTQDFNTYYFGHQIVNYRQGVPVEEIHKKKRVSDDVINKGVTYAEVEHLLDTKQSIARQLSAASTAFTYVSNFFDFSKIIGPTDYLYRTGVESTPFEIFKLIGIGQSTYKGHYRFRNKTLKTSRYKVDDTPSEGWDFPTELIYPMLEGPNIKPFTYDCSNLFHIIPYRSYETRKPIDIIELTSSNLRLATYFANHRSLLESQSEKSKTMHCGDAFYALSKIGPYTFAPCIVAARDNSRFCATIVKPSLTPWGELKQTICVKHTIIISQDKLGNFISEDEAHYINGVLNSSIVVAYIHNTFKTNGFSLNKSHIFIPKYRNEPLFNAIVELSKEGTEFPEKNTAISEKLTNAYIELCNIYNVRDE